MDGFARAQAEVLRHLQVEAVYPRQGCAVSLGILALVGAQVLVLLHEAPEGFGLLGGGEAVLVDKLQLVFRAGDVHEVEGVLVAIHVVAVIVVVHAGGIGGVVEADGGRKVLAVVLAIGQGGDELVRREVLRIVELGVVGAVDGIETLPGGVGLITGQAGDLFRPLVGVGEHEVQILDRLSGHHGVERGAVTARIVVEDDGTTGHILIHQVVARGGSRVIQTVVGASEATEVAVVDDVPVAHHDVVDVLVIHPFHGQGQRERNGQAIVHGERVLPDLRHFEVIRYACDRGA